MADRRLGDVPGIDDLLLSPGRVMAPGFSINEVNSLGEITASAYQPGALADPSTEDPFSVRAGFLDYQGPDSEGPGYVALHDPMASSHLPTYDSADAYGDGTPSVIAGPTASETGQWDQEQLDNARTIARVGQKLGASDRDIQVALMAAIVESGLKNLDYGDRDSIGLFQQRDAWGSREDRLNPSKAAEMFFLGGQGGQQGLLDIKNRGKRSLGDLAQDVQVSAYPDRYAQHETEAGSLLGAVSSTEIHAGHGDPYALTEIDGKTVDRMTAAALNLVQKKWGGSGFNILQGSHSTAVDASGNTHAGGGVIDIAPTDGDWVGLMTALRKVGFAAWIRNMPGYGQAGSGAHIHAVLIGDDTLSPEAQTQVQSYLNNDDGLTGSRPDDGPRQFINNRFIWGKRPRTQEDRWRDHVTRIARAYLGTPFRWGGEDHTGIDSQNLIHNIYSQVGLDMPLTDIDLLTMTDPIPVSDARRGDLIAWDKHPERGGAHFGIYLGGGLIVEAGGPGRVVQMNELGNNILSVFGIPIQRLLDEPPKARSLGRPAPGPSTYRVPGGGTYTPSTYGSPGHVTTPAGSSGGSSHSYTEPGAHVPASGGGGGHHANPHGGQMPGTGGLNPNHPHAPMTPPWEN